MIDIATIRRMGAAGGWRLDQCERVLRMTELLAGCLGHPHLRDVLALKGGTAINVLDHDLPRLSVDLDFNFVGARDAAALEQARPQLVRSIDDVAARLGLTAARLRESYGGISWRMTYRGVVGSGAVEIDLNLLQRVPLLATRRVDARALDDIVSVDDVLAMSSTELVAGKLMALLDRTHPRDVWDTDLLAAHASFDDEALRRCFVAYLAAARRPWRELLAKPIAIDATDTDRMLVPLLRGDQRPDEDDPMHAAILASPPLVWKSRHVRERAT